MSVKLICLSQSGKIEELSIDKNVCVSTFNKSNLPVELTRKAGSYELSRECDYDYNDHFVTIYAFTEGKAGTENKHELPPPLDNSVYYGNIYALYHENEKLCNMSIEDYKSFYEAAFGGFEDLDDEDESEEDDDDDSDLDGFIVKDDETESTDYEDSEEESEYDADEDKNDDDLLEMYEVYKHYIATMKKSGRSASASIQEKLKKLAKILEERELL
jgi:hypothetical protein